MKQTLPDKVVSYFNPVKGLQRKAAREVAESIYNVRGTNAQTRNYRPNYPTNPNLNVSIELEEAQNRASGLYFENPIASGIINSMVDGSIGSGLMLQSVVRTLLLSDVQKEKIVQNQRLIEEMWHIWSTTPSMCDHYGKQTFGGLQREAFIDSARNGDVLQRIKIVRVGGLYLPQIQNISGKSVKSPNFSDNAKIAGGVVLDSNGRETGYRIETATGGDMQTVNIEVPKFGGQSRRLMYNLVAVGTVVPGQVRGRSILTRVAEQIIQIGRYSEAELVKAILQSYMTIFIETAAEADELGDGNPIDSLVEASRNTISHVDPAGVQIEEDEVDDQITLGPGAIWNLRPGQKANLPESKSPVEQFWQFMEANLKLIGMSVGIPYEVLIKSFNASYSASQASIQDAARGWKILTTEFASKYCQPVYEQFVELLVRQGLLDCPKFDKGLFFQKAWTGAEWYGPVVLNINPMINARASELLIKNQLSTKTIESRKYGNDFDTDIKVLGEEQRMAEANLGAPAKEEEKDE